MMKNKIHLKKYLFLTFFITILFLILSLIINIYEYHIYTCHFNDKISSIITTVKEKYPDISNEDIISIFNSTESNTEFFKTYGIDIKKEDVLLENNRYYHQFLILHVLFLVIVIFFLLLIFLRYDYKKDCEIKEITKYIEEINRKNYSLHIDEISEDELSILKNELYKTTIMLKESAENSLKDKVNLKKSLEDVSHQLKTPLTSILIILDNLIDDPDMDKATREEFIRDIKREITNINFLIQALLKLSKFDSNTIHFIKEIRLLNDIVIESIKNVSTLCDLKNIKINIKGRKNSSIECDFKWQVEAITNIIKNCIEHSKENSTIDIAYEENKAYSSIVIKDFGDGILKEDIPKIFERFYKGKNSSSNSIGIGLALSKTIIESNNGRISVDSDNTGTTFTIKYFK